jgi:hypothetical protein
MSLGRLLVQSNHRCHVNIDQFAILLFKSRLSGKPEAEQLACVFKEECRKQNIQETVETFCDFLIATNRLTAWQCEKLRMGKYKGFYLDNYLLLEQIGKDYEFGYYKARDARDGHLVRLAVTPVNRAKGPGIEYQVYPFSQ